jgi:hypothetical protein
VKDKKHLPAKLSQPNLFKFAELPDTKSAQHDYTVPCSPKHAFESEAQLEDTLLRDHNALKVFGELLGEEITAIARQVRTGSLLAQRADLVALTSNPQKPLIVIELMLPPLDGEHITRGVGYAAALKAKDLILVAESVPENSANLLAALKYATDRLGITVHLVQLLAFSAPDGSSFTYALKALTPPKAPQPRQTFLEALALRVAELGDDSLLNCTVTEGKRLDSYLGLGNVARIRVYGGHGNARISIIASNGRTHRRLLRKRLPEHVKHHLEPFDSISWGRDGKAVVASYGFKTDTSTTRATDLSLTRIALAYMEVRLHLLAAVGDFTRAPASKTPPVRYRKGIGAYQPSITKLLRAQ